MTGQDVVNGALRLVGAVASGENPTAQESSDALEVLNNLLDSWNTQRLAIFTVPRLIFDLTAGTGAYTLGPGGTWNVAQRPPKISRVSILINTNPALPLELPIEYLSLGEWQREAVKNVGASFPIAVYDDQGFPLRTLSYWPVPNASGYQAVIYPWQALTAFPDLVTDMEFPPGYAKAIRYNLAVDLAPEFAVQQINPLVVAQAQMSLGVLKVMNSTIEPMLCDPAVVRDTRGNRGAFSYGFLSGGIEP